MEQLKKSTETINAGVSGNVECKILIDATQFSKNNLKGKDTPIKVVALNRTTTNACKAAMTKPGSQYKNNTYGVNSVVGASPWHTKNSSSVNGTVAEVKEDRLATKFVTKTIKGKKVKVASGAKYITSNGFYVYTNGKGAKRTVSSKKTKATKKIKDWRLTANELKRLKDNAHTKAYPIPTITYHNDTNDKYDILTIKNAKKGENYTIDLVYDKMNVISMTEVTATKNGNMEFNIKSSKIPSLWKKNMWESKLKNKDKFELRVAQVPNSYNGKQSYKYHTSESAYVSTSDKDAKQKKTLPVVVKPSAKLKTLITDTLDEGLEIEKGTTGISINGTKAGLNTTVKTNGLSGVDKTNLKNYVVQYELVNKSTSYKTSFMKFNEKVSEADLKVITTMLKNVKSSSKLKMAIYDTRTATNKQKPLIIHEGKYYTDGLDLIASKSAEAYIDTLSVEDYNKLLGIEDFSNDHTKKNKRLNFLWDNYYSLFQ